MSQVRPDPGSFRDPGSRVYRDGDRVLRALSVEADRDFEAARVAPFFRKATEMGQLVQTTRLEDAPPELDDEWAAVVEHPAIPLWTYPYEWSFSMLRDAALLQLDLEASALADEIACKDATPFNIQFDGTRPVFIDVGSFERYREGEPWYGYLQFCQLYLNPLLLQAHAGIPFQPLLRGKLDGISPEVAWRMLGPSRLFKRGVPVHVALHARAQRRYADSTTDVKAELKRRGFNRRLILANVNGLRRLVQRLAWEPETSTWSDYGDRGHYADADLANKEEFVRRAAARRRCTLAWDIGCNDGRFSRIIAPHAERVVAFDGDQLVVDHLYRALREEGSTNIVPLVVDLADPTPPEGWANRERPSFIDRCTPDFVLALAVVHHLAITANVPTNRVLDLIRDLGARAVVEFPTEDDPMVARLLRNKREGVHAGYTLANFEAQVTDRFEVCDRLTLGTRVLFELAPR